MFSTVPGPPAARGTTWWNSRSRRPPHRWPSAATKAQLARSRAQTARLTSAETFGDVAGRSCARAGRGLRRLRALLLLEVAHQELQSAPEDLGDVTTGHRMSEQVLRLSQFVPHLLAGREPDLVPVRSARTDDGTRVCRSRHGRSERRGRKPPGRANRRRRRRRRRDVRRRTHDVRQFTLGLGNLPHPRPNIGLREPMGQQLLDRRLALEGRRREKLLLVLDGQMVDDHPGRRRAERAGHQHLRQDRKAPHRACHFDPVVDRILGEMEDGHAVLEERGIAGGLVEPPGIELREMHDEGGRRFPLAPGETDELAGQLGVSEMRDARRSSCLLDSTPVGQDWSVNDYQKRIVNSDFGRTRSGTSCESDATSSAANPPSPTRESRGTRRR